MKRVVSVSLGSSKRDKRSEATLLGEQFTIERIGTDGDLAAFAKKFEELDGSVDCFGVGGADIALVIDSDRYEFREIRQLISGAKKTPVVDGGGLKHTLEREAIRWLQREGVIDFTKNRTLLVSAVDRFGMAQALDEQGGEVIYGDLPFALGVPIPLRSYRAVRTVGKILLPIVTRLPFKWLYPTGEKQTKRTPKFAKLWNSSDVIAGDWHFIRRFAPDRMDGKTIITQTVRRDDLELMKEWGVSRLVTTTPMIEGESFATNVMEAAIVALLGIPPKELRESDYQAVIQRLDWKPNVVDLA